MERGELDKERMVSMMVGRVIEDIYPDRSQVQFGPELLRVEGLTLPGKLEHVSFSVRPARLWGWAAWRDRASGRRSELFW